MPNAASGTSRPQPDEWMLFPRNMIQPGSKLMMAKTTQRLPLMNTPLTLLLFAPKPASILRARLWLSSELVC